MIRLSGVEKSFGDVTAVNALDLEAARGEITALLGANGSGKTTTLRLITGLVRRDAGTLTIDGEDPEVDPLGVRARLGVLPDGFGLYDRLTAREHLEYAGRLYGLAGRSLHASVERVLGELSMPDLGPRRCAGFSHGQRMKVALGCCLVAEPSYLILDEPTRGLDILSIRLLREVLRERRSRGVSILLASHAMQEVEALADRIVVISNGRNVGTGSRTALLSETGAADLESAFVALAGA